MGTWFRLSTGVLLTVVLLVLGFAMLDREPRVGAVLLAFGALRGALVARQVWGEWSGSSLGE
jgi:hypothetical protein